MCVGGGGGSTRVRRQKSKRKLQKEVCKAIFTDLHSLKENFGDFVLSAEGASNVCVRGIPLRGSSVNGFLLGGLYVNDSVNQAARSNVGRNESRRVGPTWVRTNARRPRKGLRIHKTGLSSRTLRLCHSW